MSRVTYCTARSLKYSSSSSVNGAARRGDRNRTALHLPALSFSLQPGGSELCTPPPPGFTEHKHSTYSNYLMSSSKQRHDLKTPTPDCVCVWEKSPAVGSSSPSGGDAGSVPVWSLPAVMPQGGNRWKYYNSNDPPDPSNYHQNLLILAESRFKAGKRCQMRFSVLRVSHRLF